MSSSCDRYLVVGNPIAHSRSPQIHVAFAQQFGLKISYEKAQVPLNGFATFLDQFFATGGKGVNVTVPFKLEAYEYVDTLDEFASVAGAVNTIKYSCEGQRLGFNTDGIGLRNDLQQRFGLTLRNKSILILGAGGATQGVLRPLLDCAPKALWVANRTVAKGVSLVAQHQGAYPSVDLQAMSFDDVSRHADHQHIDIVINATSTGLDGGAPLISADLVDGRFCYDMSYGDAAQFQRWAIEQGASQSVDGLGMLVEQAAESFYIWTAHRPRTEPVLAMLR